MLEKVCTSCDKSKSLDEFHPAKGYKLGRRAMCIPCEREYRKHWNRSGLYGISKGQFEKMVADQNGKCAICERLPQNGENLCVDHDHNAVGDDGKPIIRGLLCKDCNLGLGKLGDTPDRISKALEYLLGATVRVNE